MRRRSGQLSVCFSSQARRGQPRAGSSWVLGPGQAGPGAAMLGPLWTRGCELLLGAAGRALSLSHARVRVGGTREVLRGRFRGLRGERGSEGGWGMGRNGAGFPS